MPSNLFKRIKEKGFGGKSAKELQELASEKAAQANVISQAKPAPDQHTTSAYHRPPEDILADKEKLVEYIKNYKGDKPLDLSGCNLSAANLTLDNLSFVDFTNTDLSYANLSNTSLGGTCFRGANLACANLTDAFAAGDFTGADLTEATLARTIFRHCNLTSACLKGAVLTCADFNRAKLEDANFKDAMLHGAIFPRKYADLLSDKQKKQVEWAD